MSEPTEITINIDLSELSGLAGLPVLYEGRSGIVRRAMEAPRGLAMSLDFDGDVVIVHVLTSLHVQRLRAMSSDMLRAFDDTIVLRLSVD